MLDPQLSANHDVVESRSHLVRCIGRWADARDRRPTATSQPSDTAVHALHVEMREAIDHYGLACKHAAPAAVVAPQWRPIATAPRDGTDVLLVLPALENLSMRHPRVCVGFWAVTEEIWAHGANMSPVSYHREPTHWQPLPAPPEPKP